MTALEKTIGYTFRDPELLRTALTHSSYVNEHGLRKQDCNERMEFLGDAVLEAVSSRCLYERYPEYMEGDLSKKRASLVCEQSLAAAARKIGLGSALYLGHGMDLSGGRKYDSVLSDAFESLLAALVLDGARETAEKLITELVMNREEPERVQDPKTALQELVQEKNLTVEYVLLGESGPEHDKEFKFETRIAGRSYGTGTGRSKKAAQRMAAEKTIEMIKDGKCI